MDNDLNVKPEMLKALEENISSCLQDIGVAKDFHSEFRPITDKWNQTKKSLYSKRNNTVKRKPR